ncbi:protein kinase [Streptomyces sp. NPDC057806]|uniref:serine/threonine-protein kinase n=1 Tax=Streptomyces sp. NPDC057806 TaxID=3346255 RepID=UPI0036C30BFE
MTGRYRLVESIGQGGMGRVWRAADEILDRPVAIKEMRIDALDAEDSRTRRERTLREARATARIDHAHVVRVYDVVDEGERLWIVMELVDGRSLERLIAEEGPLGPAEAARVGLGLVAALRQVHERGVLHRDIKPGNVLVEARTGRVVLTDFGIAAIQDAKALTMVGMLVGSPDYMAPERISGRPQGPPSDIWSLGATLCAALGGRSPFSRGTTLATLHAVLYEEPELPAAAGPLRDVLAALLEKEPEARPGLADLESALEPIAFPPPTPTAVVVTAPEAPGPVPEGAQGRDPREPEAPEPADAPPPEVPRPTHDFGHRGPVTPEGGTLRTPGVSLARTEPEPAVRTHHEPERAGVSRHESEPEWAAVPHRGGKPEQARVPRPESEPESAGVPHHGSEPAAVLRHEAETEQRPGPAPAPAPTPSPDPGPMPPELPGPAVPARPRPSRRGPVLLAAAGLVTAGAVVAVVLLMNSGGSPEDDKAGGSTPSSSAYSPSPSPTVEGTARPRTLPPGARTEAGGFAWAPPEGWRRDVKTGAEVHYTAPDGTQELVAKSSLARGDLMETWETSEQNAHQGQAYQKIRLEETTFRGSPAVVWEYAFTLEGVHWHARLLGFNEEGKSYQINTWYQPDSEEQALSTYEEVKESFTIL